MNLKKRLLLAVISGILLFLSFPKYGAGIVAWFALVPLLYSLSECTIRSGFITGLVSGFIFNVGIIYWITFVVVNYGYLPLGIGIAAMLFLALYLSLYVSLFAGGIVYFKERGLSPIISAPLLWTCLEYTKSHLFTGFPWENLAYSQYAYTTFIQISDLTGIYGVTFIIVLINALTYEILINLNHNFNHALKKRLIMQIIGGMLLIFCLWIYGSYRISQVQAALKNAPYLETSLIQGNIDQSIKWNPENQNKTLEIYGSLSNSYLPRREGLIVWPETAVPFFFQDAGDRSRGILQVAKTSGNWLLIGSPSYTHGLNSTSFFNSAFLISPEGTVDGRYNKVHLVPYGEYVPLRKFFPFINKLVAGIGDFQEGEGYQPLDMRDRKVGVLICYEAIFPEASRIYKKKGADLLINITNDAWFGRTSAPYQHLSMTIFRAIENRLYILRAANTGISAIIDPIGNIVSQTGLFDRTVLKGMPRFIDKKTYYMAYGDSFVYFCIFIMGLLFLNFRKRRTQC